jgi:predicted TIM-barrel fold metal-dependent hydrolase
MCTGVSRGSHRAAELDELAEESAGHESKVPGMTDGAALLAHARGNGFRHPPSRIVEGPVFDIHTHASRKQSQELMEAADIYGIVGILSIGGLDDGLRLRDRYPGRVIVATQLDWDMRTRPAEFTRANEILLRRAAANDVPVVKLWFGPRIYPRYDGLRLDALLLDPVFDTIDSLGLRVLVHIADPDTWFATKYTDTATYGTKPQQYAQLETRLRRYPRVSFLVPHMGGHPEDLVHLGDLLDRYSNLSFDMSATRWMVREIGKQREGAGAFFARYADRLLWGSDQVVLDEPEPDRYMVRYWIQQMFWETDLVCPLAIDDPDAGPTPMQRGVALPPAVLRKVYWENTRRWLGLK